MSSSSSPSSPVRFIWPLPVLAGTIAGAAVGGALGRVLPGVIVGIGVAAVVVLLRVATRRPRRPFRAVIDPFTVNDPWRRMVQQALSAQGRFEQQVRATPDGPIREYLNRVAEDLSRAVSDIWHIAEAGNRLDKTVRELGPTRLRTKMNRLQAENQGSDDPNLDAAIDSMGAQLDAVDEIEAQSAHTESKLRLEVTRLGEVVASAALVTSGSVSQERYDLDVRSLVSSVDALQSATNELAKP